MKYTDFEVVLAEIPDEITLAINISNCPYRCPGCHSPHLWKDVGTVLSPWELTNLIRANKGITCVAFMGGPFKEVAMASDLVHKAFPNLKTAWYTGSPALPIYNHSLNYIKIGRYIAELGPLNSPKTNQCLYKIDDLGIGLFKGMQSITRNLWKNLK